MSSPQKKHLPKDKDQYDNKIFLGNPSQRKKANKNSKLHGLQKKPIE